MPVALRYRTRHGEEGNVLVICLLFMTIFGLIAGALLTQTDASFRNTSNLRDYEAKVYAADGGIEYGIQAIRQDNTLCPNTGALVTLPSKVFNGRTVEVTCQTHAGSAIGPAGFAVITTAPSDGIQTQGGGDKRIEGSIWSAALANDIPNLVVEDGDLYEQKSADTCATNADKPTGVTIEPSPPYGYVCTSEPQPEVDHALPSAVPALAPLPVISGTCTAFYPGRYNAIVLNKQNYFSSGVYYFENVELRVSNGDVIVGGAAAADEVAQNPAAACSSDAALGVSNGTGVKFILGGASKLVADNPAGEIELFRRQGGDETAEGAQGISLQTVEDDAATAGWLPYLRVEGNPLIQVGTGNTPQFTIHGLVYTPNAVIDFNATNESSAQVRGGIVCYQLILRNSASATGLVVSTNPGVGGRDMYLTATAKDLDGGRDIVSRSVLTIDNTPARSVTIISWRTT